VTENYIYMRKFISSHKEYETWLIVSAFTKLTSHLPNQPSEQPRKKQLTN